MYSRAATAATRLTGLRRRFASSSSNILCIGLGNMGGELAQQIAARYQVVAYDSSAETARAFSSPNDSARSISAEKDLLHATSEADVVLTCLPNSPIVSSVVSKISTSMRAGSIWIDATSGDPSISSSLAEELLAEREVHFLDCAVSGGPAGARKGVLTAMMGGNDDDAIDRAREVVSCFASNINILGPPGAGHAVKAVNNTLLAAHLCAAGEAIVALKAFGVKPSAALGAINTSSGRSWATQQRLPDNVLSRKFDYGFQMALLLKDVRTGLSLIRDEGDREGLSILRQSEKILERALGACGEESDHVEVVRLAEKWAGGVEICDGP